jgi:hypothetical protein
MIKNNYSVSPDKLKNNRFAFYGTFQPQTKSRKDDTRNRLSSVRRLQQDSIVEKVKRLVSSGTPHLRTTFSIWQPSTGNLMRWTKA